MEPNQQYEFLKDLMIYGVAFSCSFLAGTWIIRYSILKHLADPAKPTDERAQRVGFWIGFCETLIIFLLISADQYGALAIILGAKEFVRKEKIQESASYYLLGTLVNLSVALVAVRLAMVLTEWN
jgi:prolipoprotein diacylglyceryltransferase